MHVIEIVSMIAAIVAVSAFRLPNLTSEIMSCKVSPNTSPTVIGKIDRSFISLFLVPKRDSKF